MLDGMQIDSMAYEEILPLLLIVGVFSNFDTRLFNIQNLPPKKRGQVSALLQQLHKMGVKYQETADFILIHGPQQITGVVVDGIDDFHVVMALVVAALYARSSSSIHVSAAIRPKFVRFIDLLSQFVDHDILIGN